MPDFLKMTLPELDAFVVAHREELGAEGLEHGEVSTAVAEGRAVVEARVFGFAVLQLSAGHLGVGWVPHLWLLYVAEDQRGRGTGRRFMRALLRKYADYHMTLYCTGARRRKFFGAVGFVVESRDGEYRRMTTQRDWRGMSA